MSQQTENSMRKIFLSKVVLNMGVGKSGEPIEIGKKTLSQITGKKPNTRNAKKSQVIIIKGINSGHIGTINEIKVGTFTLPKRISLLINDKTVEIPVNMIMVIGKEKPVIQIK